MVRQDWIEFDDVKLFSTLSQQLLREVVAHRPLTQGRQAAGANLVLFGRLISRPHAPAPRTYPQLEVRPDHLPIDGVNAAPHKPFGLGRPALLTPVQQPPHRGPRRCLRGHSVLDTSRWNPPRAPAEHHCSGKCHTRPVLDISTSRRIRI